MWNFPIATQPRSAEVPWKKGANCLSGGGAGIWKPLKPEQRINILER